MTSPYIYARSPLARPHRQRAHPREEAVGGAGMRMASGGLGRVQPMSGRHIDQYLHGEPALRLCNVIYWTVCILVE